MCNMYASTQQNNHNQACIVVNKKKVGEYDLIM